NRSSSAAAAADDDRAGLGSTIPTSAGKIASFSALAPSGSVQLILGWGNGLAAAGCHWRLVRQCWGCWCLALADKPPVAPSDLITHPRKTHTRRLVMVSSTLTKGGPSCAGFRSSAAWRV